VEATPKAKDQRLDEVEELEALEELADEPEAAPASPPQAMLQRPEIASLVLSYSKSSLPMLILDEGFAILWANDAYRAVFAPYQVAHAPSFYSAFGPSIGLDEVKRIHAAARSKESLWCWKGSIASKTRDAATLIAKTYVLPLFSNGSLASKPHLWYAIFDDVTEENRAVLRRMFLSLLEASKLKDNDTGSHIGRVNLYSRRMAEELYRERPDRYPEVDVDFIEDIGFLAAMHDVGKIGTPDDILNKAGPLSPWEWKIMKEHTINGAYILSTYPNPMARQIALSHHEMWDGKGYPYGHEGLMIPLAARIVAIADVYDALRMKRSYKDAYTHEVAAEKIADWGGSHFDPEMADVFAKVSGDIERIFEENKDPVYSGSDRPPGQPRSAASAALL
jgi:putative two-component system response regulator